MGEGHGKVSVSTAQQIKKEKSFGQDCNSKLALMCVCVCVSVFECVSHLVFAGCWSLAAIRQPSLQEPGSAEKQTDDNMMNGKRCLWETLL